MRSQDVRFDSGKENSSSRGHDSSRPARSHEILNNAAIRSALVATMAAAGIIAGIARVEAQQIGCTVLADNTKESSSAVENDRLRQLIQQLGDGKFSVRQQATMELMSLSEQALPILWKSRSCPDLEVRRRLEEVITQLIQRSLKLEKTFDCSANPISNAFPIKATERVLTNNQGHFLQQRSMTDGHKFSEIALKDFANHLAVSPDGAFACVASKNSFTMKMQIWNLATGKIERELPVSQPVVAMQYSPCGRFLLTCNSDGSLQLWDVKTGALVRKLQTSGEQVASLSACFSLDGTIIFTSNSYGLIRRMDAMTAEIQTSNLFQPQAAKSMQMMAGDLLVSYRTTLYPDGCAGQLLVLDGRTLQYKKMLYPHEAMCVDVSSSGRWVAIGLQPKLNAASLQLYNSRLDKSFVLPQEVGRLNSLHFTEDERSLISSGPDGNVRLWHVPWLGRE